MLNKESSHYFEEEIEPLPFAKMEIVRLMKMNLDCDKMIRERVKVEMNRFLYKILQEVCHELNKHPYSTIEYEMFEEAIYPYTNVRNINEEKKRILEYMDEIKSDCDVLGFYVKKTLKMDESEEEDEFFPLTGKMKKKDEFVPLRLKIDY